ncbi:M48 family metalloprotease [Castellaniella sp. FW104-16D08]|uniref:M48 family metalloprotease n=1 Tax=unclassified Castellaniella TaxID=2617606 RepID=UPI00331561A3
MSTGNPRILFAILLPLLLSACANMGQRPGWIPVVFNDDTPYLAQLHPALQSGDPNNPRVISPQARTPIAPDKATSDTLAAASAETPKEMLEDLKQVQSESLGLVSAPKLEKLLNDELQHIKDSSGFGNHPAKVYLLAAAGMSARTSAAGNIYIPLPSVLDIQTLDEMDALLAHEFAHAALSHNDTDLIKSLQKKATTLYAVANKLDMNQGELESVSRRIRNSVAMYQATEKILSPGWTRTQETDADRLAIDFLVVSGRNLNSMTALLSRIEQWNKNNAALLQQYAPKGSLLVAAATKRFAQNDWQALAISALEPLALQVEEKINQLSNTHDEIQARQDDVAAYIRAHYRRVARPAPQTAPWRRIAHNTQTRRLSNSVEYAMLAWKKLNEGDVRAARNQLAKANNRDARSQTFYQLVQAAIEEASGRPDRVLRIAAHAEKSPYPSFWMPVMAQRARMNSHKGSPNPAAVEALYAAFDQFGRPPNYYSDLITMAAKADNTGLRLQISTRCMVEYFGDSDACLNNDARDTKAKQSQTAGHSGVVGTFLGLFN